MFFNFLSELENICKNSHTAIILLKDGQKVNGDTFLIENLVKSLKNVFLIAPGQTKNTSNKPINSITIDQIRTVIQQTTTKQQNDQYFIFNSADKMQVAAANASLKLLEEPKEKYHFLLFTTDLEALLPTIRSRAYLYAPKSVGRLESPINAEKAVYDLAKRLLIAKNNEIIELAEELHKLKDTDKFSRRDFTLKVIETTIEFAEKSYFKTQNKVFTKKITGLINAYQNIKNNGTIRLQIVANLV